ncbi:hypothetical protein C2845_PM01G31140 [Panicum miliaceum]|uniref:non-specific serine/threonine protein kinase n=1 Tax=Panicum miliaceum TaxID=4540 RepID=A0A3L6TRC8_PANMI|nr:hypothetical protein C2845_PM01G31140 [Panicum miliaceum]
MSPHAAPGGAHEDMSWSALGRRAPRDVMVGDRGGWGGGVRRRAPQGGPAGAVRVDGASCASTFRELDDAFLQKQTKIWLGEVLHLWFDETVLVADLLADGELLYRISKVIWKRLLKKNREQLTQSKVYIYERPSFGRSHGKYMPYLKVDSFLKICQILGLAGIDMFTPSDVVEKRNVRKVCICIRSASKKSNMMHLNVPDFDIVTYTISMPNYIVGGIRRSLEQPQYSSSGSSGYSPPDSSKALQQQASFWKGFLLFLMHLLNIYSRNIYFSQIIFGGQNNKHGDTNYDSDEAESRPSVLEPEDSVDEDNFAAVLSPPKEEIEGYGESGHDMDEEKSLAESVGSLNFDVMDSESMDSTPQNHDKESYSTHSATDQCSISRTAKCSLSSEEADSISSYLAFESGKNDSELNAHPVADSEWVYDGKAKSLDHSIQGNGETLVDHPKKESADLQKDTGTINLHCDALACDRESVCSSCGELMRHGLNGEPSDLSKSPMVSEDAVNNIEPSLTGMTNDSTCEELNPEFSYRYQMEGSQPGDKPVDSDGIAKPPQVPEDDAPKSGKGVLKSVAGGIITLAGAVFFMVHLRRSKERNFTRVIPSLPEKSIQSDSRAKNMDNEKAPAVYPGAQLKSSLGNSLSTAAVEHRRNMEWLLLCTMLVLASLLPVSASNREGDVLLDMKLTLNATDNQLADWNPVHVTPCTWSHIIYDENNSVVQVSLLGNKITGGITEQFGNLSRLIGLYLEDNLLVGAIPASLGQLSNLQYLILSQNNLDGSIPDTLANMSSLIEIFSGNDLTCGPNFLHPCASTSNVPYQGLSHDPKIGIVVGPAGGVMGLLIVGAVFIFCNGRTISHLSEVYADVPDDIQRTAFGQLKRFAWQELEVAIDNFSERNILGRGGFGQVYKGMLPDGTMIAVKRSDCGNPGGEAALREVELISVAVHRNLLRLIGLCTTQTERLLVYPFMQNLSVAYRLREFKPGEPVLDWSARKRVARGTARALEYLHEQCNPKIIHRDVKAANVLLDEGFEPVVGDFGLAKLVDVRISSVTTKICGTLGHIAPECLLTGKFSERTDVYGYGVMLLELVTGKRAADFPNLVEEDDVLFLDHVVQLHREGSLDTIVDRNLKNNYARQEVEEMVQIALPIQRTARLCPRLFECSRGRAWPSDGRSVNRLW